MSNARIELGGGNWAAKNDGVGGRNLLGYAVGDTSGKYISRDFYFSRAGDIAATRVNKDGLIEKYRENVLLNSGDFSIAGASGGWVKNNSTATSGYAGYDGTNNAWKLESTVLTSYNNLNQQETHNAAITPLTSKVATFSVYLKAGTTNWVRLNLNNTGNVYFDLENGVVGTDSGASVFGQIESAGNGFYRCSITRIAGSAFDACYIYLAESDGSLLPNTHSTPEHIFVQNPQLEYGLVATDYIETDSSTASAGVLDNLPRIDYKNGSAQLLIEPSTTNLVSLSEGIPEATGAVTRTLNYGVAPDGTTSSLKVQKNGVSENDRIIVSDDLAVSNATTYTVSGFVKNIDIVDVGVTTIAARVDAGTLFRKGYEWTGSSLASTSYGDNGSTSNTILEDYGNGWWRIGFTFTTDGTQLDFEIDIDRRNGSDTTSIETWGWQFEENSFATSYIPTYGVSDTRPSDICNNFDDIQIGNSHTILFDFDLTNNPVDNTIAFSMFNSSGTLSFTARWHGSTDKVRVYNNIDTQYPISTFHTSSTKKWVLRIDGTAFDLFHNNSGTPTKTSGTAMTTARDLDEFQFKQTGTYVNNIKIFDSALSDSECKALVE